MKPLLLPQSQPQPHPDAVDSLPPTTLSSSTPFHPSPSLLSALVVQLDFYFSPSNLSSDSFLLSQMDSERYVPIAVIANFRKVRQLTTDLPTILHAMSSCSNLQLDASHTLVRPAHRPPPAPRTVLILRDVPQEVAEDEVAALFALEGCPAVPVSVGREGAGLWRVELAGEEECRDTALWLTNQSLRGQLVKCRVKAEPHRTPHSPFVPSAALERGAAPSYGYELDSYAAQSASAYQHMGSMPAEQVAMLYGGGGGYFPYGQAGEPHLYGGGAFSSSDAIDLHIPLPQTYRPTSAAHPGKKGRLTGVAHPSAASATSTPTALNEVIGAVQLAGEASAPGAGKKKGKKKKKAAAAAALAAASASCSSVAALPVNPAAPATAIRLIPASASSTSVATPSSSSASIPLIAPSSYAAAEHRAAASVPTTPASVMSSPSSFPPISAASHSASSSNPTPATSSTSTASATQSSLPVKAPVLLNYASHVGSLSAAEVARVAATARAVKDAKQQPRPDKSEKETLEKAMLREEKKEDDAPATLPASDAERGKESAAELTHPAPRPSREGGLWVKRDTAGGGGASTPSWRERHREYRKVIHAPHPQRYQPRVFNSGASPSPTSSTSASSAHSTASSSSSPSSPSSSSSALSSNGIDTASAAKRPMSYAELIKRTSSASPHSGRPATQPTAASASALSTPAAVAPVSPGAKSDAALQASTATDAGSTSALLVAIGDSHASE